MSCPDQDLLYRYCDDELEGSERGDVEAHLADCEACSALVAEEQAFARKVGELACPDPETLARFIDDVLPAEALERVAAHVLECEPCRDVVAWTREGQKQAKQASGRRRRRTVHRRRGDTVPTWAPLVAAAALFFVLTLWVISRPNTPVDVAQDDTPQLTPDVPERGPLVSDRPQDTTPDAPRTTPDAPETTPDTTPDTPETTPDAPDTTPDTPETTPDTTPDAPSTDPTDETRTDPEPAPRASAGAVIALAGGGLRWSGQDQVERPLRGTTALSSKDIISSGREGGGFQIGSTVLMLTANASVQLGELREDKGPGRLTLLEGEALVETDDQRQELAMGEAVVTPGGAGGRMLIGKGPEFFTLCVVDGAANVRMGQASVRLGPGEGRRVKQGGALEPLGRDLSGTLRRATRLASEADGRRAIESPRGFLALRGLRALPQPGGSLADEAAALLAVDALGLDPSLAGLPSNLRGLNAASEERRALLADAAPEVLASAGAASEALLSLLSRHGRKPKGAVKARVQALALAIAARPAAELAGDGLALLALRAVASAKLAKLPRGLFKEIGEEIALDGPYDLGRALLAGRKVSKARQAQLLEALDRDLSAGALSGAQLLEAQRALLLSGAFNAERAGQLDVSALALTPSPELALLYARLPGRLLGRKLVSPASSVRGVAAPGGMFRVTFTIRPQARVRGVFLCGSWDGWDEASTPMERQSDGSFKVTLLLPAKVHQYKLRLTDGSWEIDQANPLSTDDERGGLNSILPLN